MIEEVIKRCGDEVTSYLERLAEAENDDDGHSHAGERAQQRGEHGHDGEEGDEVQEHNDDEGHKGQEHEERGIPGHESLSKLLMLYRIRQRTSSGDHADEIRNKLIVRHEHITQHKFRVKSRKYICELEKSPEDAQASGPYTVVFEDSDDEFEDKENLKTGVAHTTDLQRARANHSRVVAEVAGGKKEIWVHEPQDSDDVYDEDAKLDRPAEASGKPMSNSMRGMRYAIFPSRWGYGQPCFSPCCVLSVLGEPTPLYFWQIDSRRLKMTYTDSEGLPVAYVFHKRLLLNSLKAYRVMMTKEEQKRAAEDKRQEQGSKSGSEDNKSSADGDSSNGDSEARPGHKKKAGHMSIEDSLLAYREKLLRWLTDLVRSPLPNCAILWFLDKLENGMTVHRAPILDDLNLNIIAHCVAMSLPSPNECKPLFCDAFRGEIPQAFLKFCQRKNDLYGIHIVKGGTLNVLEQWGAVVETVSLGYDALTRSKDNASMYLEIINKFSTLTWIVYVTGLETIDDALLKWLAEYTKEHPWRFVYLENTQTSWNFSENRDRCVQDFAPPPLERDLAYTADLTLPGVTQLRPSHVQPYPRVRNMPSLDENSICNVSWEDMSVLTASFFLDDVPSAKLGAAHASSSSKASRAADWLSFCEKNTIEENFQERCTTIFDSDDPCVVLLFSPPGTCFDSGAQTWI